MIKLSMLNKEMVESYNLLYNVRMSEINFTNLFAWKKKYNFHYKEINGYLFLINIKDSHMYFSQAIGPLNDFKILEDTIDELMFEYKLKSITFKKCNRNFKVIMENLNRNIEVTEMRDDFDYLYDFNNLRSLSGKLYHKKKNHLNQFKKNYNWTYKKIDTLNFDDVNLIKEEWFKDAAEELLYEKEAIETVLSHWHDLNVSGGILYVEGRPVAFAIGEIIQSDTLLIHFEKALTAYKGIYAMITNCYLNDFEGLTYVNREQDLGMPGLRKSKLSYHPIDFISKYNLIIKN